MLVCFFIWVFDGGLPPAAEHSTYRDSALGLLFRVGVGVIIFRAEGSGAGRRDFINHETNSKFDEPCIN